MFENTIPRNDPEAVGVEENGRTAGKVDVAARFLSTLDNAVTGIAITPKESRKVLWKIDLTTLPLIWLSVIIAAVDKVVISNAAIYGMKADTHLAGNQFAWVGR